MGIPQAGVLDVADLFAPYKVVLSGSGRGDSICDLAGEHYAESPAAAVSYASGDYRHEFGVLLRVLAVFKGVFIKLTGQGHSKLRVQGI